MLHNRKTAYIVGVAIGDGNLSNPNKRAQRLRISCDNKYPKIISNIQSALKDIFPENKVSKYYRKVNCTDVYVYSNKLESILGWKALEGSKYRQRVRVPDWIYNNKSYSKSCLKGLFETDGSVYKDRKYTYCNLTTVIPGLAQDAKFMINKLNYRCHTYISKSTNGYRFTIRISKEAERFIKEIKILKK